MMKFNLKSYSFRTIPKFKWKQRSRKDRKKDRKKIETVSNYKFLNFELLL
jgi:hypothetical protein